MNNLKRFILVWGVQLLSQVGSGLTGFCLGVWVYRLTGSVTQFALIDVCVFLPGLVVPFFSSFLVDRWSWRKILVLGDSGAALGTLALALLLASGKLQVWHLYVTAISGAVFNSLRWPAFHAMTMRIVPKEQLGRANGMMQAAEAGSRVLAPVLAGGLLLLLPLQNLLWVDLATFLVAIAAFITLPVLEAADAGQPSGAQVEPSSFWAGRAAGWTFVRKQPALLSLLLFLAVINFQLGLVEVLFTPLVLNVASIQALGILSSLTGVGMLGGSLLMVAWGGPRRRVRTVFFLVSLQGLMVILVSLKPSVVFIGVGAFLYVAAYPIITSCCQTLWQTRVPRGLQGRVFSVRSAIDSASMPLAFLLAGPVVDRVTTPLMSRGGKLDGTLVEKLLGRAPAGAVGLVFFTMGVLTLVSVGIAWFRTGLPTMESALPDLFDGDRIGERSEAQPQAALLVNGPS